MYRCQLKIATVGFASIAVQGSKIKGSARELIVRFGVTDAAESDILRIGDHVQDWNLGLVWDVQLHLKPIPIAAPGRLGPLRKITDLIKSNLWFLAILSLIAGGGLLMVGAQNPW